ncbi:MAG: hypothetical protein Q9219_000179 [cf. Caloplaca sp. 3 TL-2023]
MGKKRKHLSHEEIWDDSALLNSWDAALNEYQHYHSIHARGEKVEDVLREAEVSEKNTTSEDPDAAVSSSNAINGFPSLADIEDGEIEDDGINDNPVAAGSTEEEVIGGKIPTDQSQDAPTAAQDQETQRVKAPQDMPSMLVNGESKTKFRRQILDDGWLEKAPAFLRTHTMGQQEKGHGMHEWSLHY